ncbi:hypothetical protein CGRA01v4_15060 [Colletotrichum graminicola]|uniref:Uncharacterized protein n=1 Tax=Colletotrichum graminicola (strain M1.001 / M2 / FGSC 10212) TaxID=645133 RepID=E3QZ45_COLGM|nr:uncharacterized protein GLRG_11277 [Colletotrichum graminicola M1.001]EFQ36133.1 hypothetical protein GLRG_11277 [Colletotrichum graminicola M1.001]WDK23768.1 hypothetical protein CGRA01v4_15060 [Colletotrichum graminicola]
MDAVSWPNSGLQFTSVSLDSAPLSPAERRHRLLYPQDPHCPPSDHHTFVLIDTLLVNVLVNVPVNVPVNVLVNVLVFASATAICHNRVVS